MLSDRKVFLAIGGVLVGLFVLSFAAVAILKVATGHSLDVLYNPRVGPVFYVTALASFVILLAAIIFTVVSALTAWYRKRR